MLANFMMKNCWLSNPSPYPNQILLNTFKQIMYEMHNCECQILNMNIINSNKIGMKIKDIANCKRFY
jgi:hypothetical protein